MITEFQVLKYKVKYFETQLNIERCNIKYYKQDCIQSSTTKVECMYTQNKSTHT